MQPDHLVLGFEWEGDARAFPLRIMNWHEIVNDVIGGREVVVTYCPLCRTGLVFDRRLEDGALLTFGNTGSLYESAMVMYDHQTDSKWWQAAGEAITGPLTGTRLTLLPAITSTWPDWVAIWPQTQVLSRNTGHRRDYDRDAFAAYSAVDSEPAFPISFLDDRLLPKERVLGVETSEGPVAYSLTALEPWTVLHDRLDGRPVVVFSGPSDAGAVFEAIADGRALDFAAADGSFRDDQTGSTWNLAGRAVDGPLNGTQLEPVASFASYWFSWATVWPESRIMPESAVRGATGQPQSTRPPPASAVSVPSARPGASAARDSAGRFPLDPGDHELPSDLDDLSVSNAADMQPLSRKGLGTAAAASFEPATGAMAIGSKTGMISLTDSSTGAELLRWKAHQDAVNALAFSPDGSLLATAGKEGTVHLWEARTGIALFSFDHEFPVSAVAFSFDGNAIAGGDWSGKIRLWETATGVGIQTLAVGKHTVTSIAFSPDGNLLAAGTSFWPVWLFDVTSGNLLRKLEGHTRLVSDVVFSSDGRLLGSASLDGTVRIWDVDSRRQVSVVEDGALNLLRLAFSPDGTLLATGRLDGVIRLWDVESGSPLRTLSGHTDGVLNLAFAPDGRMLSSIDSSGAIWFWGVPSTSIP